MIKLCDPIMQYGKHRRRKLAKSRQTKYLIAFVVATVIITLLAHVGGLL